MVLFDADALLDFPRYGILIPALDTRKTKTLENLRAHPTLGAREREWLIDGYEATTSLEDLLRVHSPEYAGGFFDGRAAERLKAAFELVNPDGSRNRWEPDGAQASLDEMVPSLMKMEAGTYRAAAEALDSGFCHFLGGGAHHGHREFGHGFCPVNDAAVAVRKLQAEGAVRRVWIIDLDAHKGDGTAAVFSGDETVTTLSIHMAQGWPLDGSLPPGHPSYIPSDIDVPVESGDEDSYLDRLEGALGKMKASSTADMAVVLAGVDPWEGDALPSTSLLKLPMETLVDRDRYVYGFLEKAGLPSAWLTAGGYGEGSWRIHAAFLRWALERRMGI